MVRQVVKLAIHNERNERALDCSDLRGSRIGQAQSVLIMVVCVHLA